MSNLAAFSIKFILTIAVLATVIFLWSCNREYEPFNESRENLAIPATPDIEATIEDRLDFIAAINRPEPGVLIKEDEVPV